VKRSYHSIRHLFVGHEPWVEQAACRGQPTSLFFPEKGQHAREAIKRFCENCPVRRECFDYARRTRTEHGVWGGKIRDRKSQSEAE
jgi:WhiB family transcriptional regulator, redox-sensing transcriptional regulator